MSVFFLLVNLGYAGDIKVIAKEIGPELIRKDFEITLSSRGMPKVLYISKYQVVYIKIENNSEDILNVNPNYFTLISNMKRSYSYSPETYKFEDKIGFININCLQAVDVYPDTITKGFLLFDKKYKNKRPKLLFFLKFKNTAFNSCYP